MTSSFTGTSARHFYGGKHNTVADGTTSAPNSGAELSGGSALRGQYDFASNARPAESTATYFDWTESGGALSYASGYASGSYPAAVSANAVGINFKFPTPTEQEVYVEFKARMPGNKHGFKFLKVFGTTGVNAAANCTFGLDYNGTDNGGMLVWSHGDGASSGGQDTSHVISLNEAVFSSFLGRNSGAAISTPNDEFASTDWGTGWHTFRMYFKHNTGLSSETEVADGSVYIEIDGDVYLDAGGLFTRHFNNGQLIDHIGIFGWSQGGGPAFTAEYDDVVISTGGFL